MNEINDKLHLTIDKIEVDGNDAKLEITINLEPIGGEPPLIFTFNIKEEGWEILVDFNREQAVLLGQFLMLAKHVREPE